MVLFAGGLVILQKKEILSEVFCGKEEYSTNFRKTWKHSKMMKRTLVFCLLIGVSHAGGEATANDQAAAGSATSAKREAEPSTGYGPPPSSQQTEPKPVYGPPSAPESYSKAIPAAAIRNVETVAVTKTITPVVTKTTTYNTHSEPALSIGHVQGYSQSAVGHPKIAPVQFQTQYTSYLQPTVGVNGKQK